METIESHAVAILRLRPEIFRSHRDAARPVVESELALLDQRAVLWTRDKRLRAAAEKAGASLHTPANARN